MRNIVASRIDERLIHGQVMTSWIKQYDPTSIMIVDAASANNSFLSRILFAAAPKNIELLVMTEEQAIAHLQESSDGEERIFILAKTPAPFLRLIEAGIKPAEIILGNMGGAPGRKRFTRNISASEAEIDDLRHIVGAGVPVFCQMVPTDQRENVEGLL